jgi:hypothetical protein
METPERNAMSRGARVALAFLGSSLVLALGLFFMSGYQQFTEMGPIAQGVLAAVGIGVTSVSVAMGLVGVAILIKTVRRAAITARRPAVITAAVVGGPVVLLWVVLLALVPFAGMGLLLLVGTSIGAAVVTAAGPPFTVQPGAHRSGASRLALACGLAMVNLALIAAGALHILLWNPLVRVPGLAIDEIYSQMAVRGEGGGHIMVFAWAALWGLASIALAVVGSLPPMAPVLTARRMIVLALLLIGATVFFHWWAGWGMGMSLADAFGTSGGDAAVSGPILSLIGQLALVSALFIALVPPANTQGATTPARVGSDVSH